MSKQTTVLCILDGWGYSKSVEHNAIASAATPHFDRLIHQYPHCLLQASEKHVGLPVGQMGNSEVGHTNIGAGRVILQDLPRITESLSSGAFKREKPFQDFVRALKHTNKPCHLLGLLSPGGVHSHQDHIVTLVETLEEQGVQVFIHAFLDGRDTSPTSAREIMASFIDRLSTPNTQYQIATLGGRYYGMDRDQRWDRIQVAYEAIVEAKGPTFSDPVHCIEKSYAGGITDEFILPHVRELYQGMQEGDGLLVANFRADRVRQIVTALVDPRFSEFPRSHTQRGPVLAMVEYAKSLEPYYDILFPSPPLNAVLGEVIADQGMTQLRAAETEKYAHVTFFFNGGREEKFKGEERLMIASPKVKTYDQQPEMSALALTEQIEKHLTAQTFDLIVVNYANPDMVGHTGDFPAAVKAIETIDHCLQRLTSATLKIKGTLFITADHGNAEKMIDSDTGKPHTAHTLSPVPFILVSGREFSCQLMDGILADVAPTLLDYLGLPQPNEMTGKSLLVKQPK